MFRDQDVLIIIPHHMLHSKKIASLLGSGR
jgi:hypothetical protein